MVSPTTKLKSCDQSTDQMVSYVRDADVLHYLLKSTQLIEMTGGVTVNIYPENWMSQVG